MVSLVSEMKFDQKVIGVHAKIARRRGLTDQALLVQDNPPPGARYAGYNGNRRRVHRLGFNRGRGREGGVYLCGKGENGSGYHRSNYRACHNCVKQGHLIKF